MSGETSDRPETRRCDDCKGTGLTPFTGSVQEQCPTCWGMGVPLPSARRRLLAFAMLGQGGAS